MDTNDPQSALMNPSWSLWTLIDPYIAYQLSWNLIDLYES